MNDRSGLFDDEHEGERREAMWAEFLAQMPPEFHGDVEQFTASYYAILAKEKELKVYHDFYHNKFLPWQRTFDHQGYQEYLESRQQVTTPEPETVPVEPPLLPSSAQTAEVLEPTAATEMTAATEETLPREEVWSWGDLEDVQPDEDEVMIVPNVGEEEAEPPEAEAPMVPPDHGELEPVSGDVLPIVEDAPPIVARVNEENSDAYRNWDANGWRDWTFWRKCITGISAWLRRE